MSINSINDDKVFEINSVKMLYSLPVNSFTLVNNSENKIFLVKIAGSNKNQINKEAEDYKNFVNSEFTNTRKSILAAYDQLLTSKYKIQLNQKTIDRVKNYFKCLLIEASKILSFDIEAKKIKSSLLKRK